MNNNPFDDSLPFVPPRDHNDMRALKDEIYIYDLYEELCEYKSMLIQVWHYAGGSTDYTIPRFLYDALCKLIEGDRTDIGDDDNG